MISEEFERKVWMAGYAVFAGTLLGLGFGVDRPLARWGSAVKSEIQTALTAAAPVRLKAVYAAQSIYISDIDAERSMEEMERVKAYIAKNEPAILAAMKILSPEKGANESFPYIDTSDLPLALSDVANNVSLSRMHTVTQWINKQLDNALLYAGKDRPQEIKDAGCAMRRLYAAVNGNWSQMAAEDRDEPARFVPN